MNDLLNDKKYYYSLLKIFKKKIDGEHKVDKETISFSDCVEDFHRGYNPHIKKFERELFINGEKSGKYVVLEEWQISFNPLGRLYGYGYLQVSLYSPNRNPRHYWQKHNGKYQWNFLNQFRLGPCINEKAKEKMNYIIQCHNGFSIDQNRIISPPFGMTKEGVIKGLYCLAVYSLSKWKIQNSLK